MPESHTPRFVDSAQWCSDPATSSEKLVWMKWTETRKEESKVKSDCRGTKKTAHVQTWMTRLRTRHDNLEPRSECAHNQTCKVHEKNHV